MSRYFLLFLAALALTFVTGCDAGPWDAPPYAEIGEIEDIQVAWSSCRLDPLSGLPQTPGCENDPPIIIPINAMVRDVRNGSPLNNVRIWYASGFNKIFLLPQEVLEAVDLPDTERWAYLAGEGNVYAEFSGTFDGDYRPTFYEGWTDSHGLSSVWLYIEEMPTDDTGQPKESGVIISIGVDTITLKLGTAG
jgi:hypothetical protein